MDEKQILDAVHRDVPPELIPDPAEVEQFMKGRVWRYFQALLQSQKRRLDANLRTKDGVALYRDQGRAQAVDNILLMPAATIAVLNAKKQIEEKKNGPEQTATV